MYRILIKLLDDALLPAALITFAKIIGVIVSQKFLQTAPAFHAFFIPNGTLPNTISTTDLIAQNTFSDFLMYAVVFSGCLVILIKMIFFHHSHIKPTMILHLAHNNLLELIQTSFEIYSLAFIWFVFLYLVSGYIVISALVGDVSLQLAAALMIVSVVLGWVFIKDVEQEVNNNLKNKHKDSRVNVL